MSDNWFIKGFEWVWSFERAVKFRVGGLSWPGAQRVLRNVLKKLRLRGWGKGLRLQSIVSFGDKLTQRVPFEKRLQTPSR